MNALPWTLLLAAALLNGAGAILLKLSQSGPARPGLEAYMSPWFLAGGALFGITLLVVTRAFRDLPLGVAYPLFVAATQVVVCLGAVLLLGERLTLLQVVGIAIVAAGVSLIVTSSAAGTT
jgi:multidrug transporter EmrE-like cation transporter